MALYGGAPAPEVARELMTDSLITEPDRFLARQMARQGLPVFVYHFSYVPAAARPTSFGASHGSEITYVFDTLPDHPITYGPRTIPAATPDDHKLSDAMHAYWVAFAKTGDPDSAGGPRWPRFRGRRRAADRVRRRRRQRPHGLRQAAPRSHRSQPQAARLLSCAHELRRDAPARPEMSNRR